MNYVLLKKVIKHTLSEFIYSAIPWLAIALFFNYFFFGNSFTSLTEKDWYLLAGFIFINILIILIKIIYRYRNIRQ